MSAHDAAVCAGGEAVDQGVDGAEHQQRPGGAEGEQTDVKEVEQLQQFAQHGEGCRHMDARRHQGQEEHQQHLTADGGADLPGTHAHLLHDAEPVVILIALADLFVVDDQHRGHQEQAPQEDAKEQEAAGIRAVGEAEASAIQAKGIAEAEAMEKKAEAYAKYNKAAVAEMMIKVLPDIAGKVAEPLGQIDKITIIGGGEGGSNGVDQIAGNVPVVMAKVFESMKEATGIDLADIINAESYDAKVNRNVNLSGLDSVNFVVKDDGTNVTMGKPQTKVNATAVEASAQGTGTASETTNQ